MTARVFKFGCANMKRWDLPAHAIEQMRLGHELRNDLVRVERRHEDLVDALWRTIPVVAGALSERDAAEQRMEAAAEAHREARRRARSTAVEPSGEMTEAKAALAAARERARVVKDEHREPLRPRFRELIAARNAAIKDVRERWRDRGLHWGTLDAVTAGHETARKRVAAMRTQGRPAALSTRPWRGEGTITVQLMRHAWAHGCGGKRPPWPCGNKNPADCPDRREKDPVRSPGLLASGGGKWANVFQLGPWVPPGEWGQLTRGERRRLGAAPPKGGSWCRVGLGRDLPPVELPIVVDRMMPSDADVALVQVTRRMTADRPDITLAVTVRLPDPEPAAGAVVAAHMGWRALPGGDLRVAVITADRPLTAPRRDLPVHRVEHGWEVRLPERLRHAHLHTEKVTAARAVELERLRGVLRDWLTEHGPVPNPARPGEDLTVAGVQQWRAGRFAALTKAWQAGHGSGPPAGVLDSAVAWLRQDLHLWRWEAHERRDITDQVKHLWRNVAAWIASQAAVLIVDDTRISDLVRTAPVDEEDRHVARAGRRQQRAAQPGGLRQAITGACAREGVEVVVSSAAGITATHAGCGATLVGDPEPDVILWCPTCSVGVDQDLNAAEHLIPHAREAE